MIGYIRKWISDDTPPALLGESMWMLLLSNNPFALIMALLTVVLQWMILRAYAIHTTVVIFQPVCNNSGIIEQECEEWEFSLGTELILILVLLGWTVADIMTGIHFLAGVCLVWDKPLSATNSGTPLLTRMRLFLAGTVSFMVGMSTFWGAYFRTMDGAHSDLDALLNAVAILYVMDTDEAVFKSISCLAPHWHACLVNDIKEEFTLGMNGKQPDEKDEREEEEMEIAPTASSLNNDDN